MAERNGKQFRPLAAALFVAVLLTGGVFTGGVGAQQRAKTKPVPLGTPVELTPAPMTPDSAATSAGESAPAGAPLGTAVDTDHLPVLADAMAAPFTLAQLQYDRVRDARVEMRYGIKKLFRDRGLHYPAADIYLRVFKRERSLELWVRPEGDSTYSLLRTYDICALSGDLGPKRAKGDNQVPEGFYTIDRFNPFSDYHLSLHVDYPNRSDQLVSSQPDLGGDIMIHGGCNSIGCLALTDEGIKQLYWVAVEARAAGQQRIPVDIFPAHLDDENLTQLARVFRSNTALVSFWKSLKPGYDFFEAHHTLPNVRVDAVGHYIVNNPAVPGVPTTTVGPRALGKPVSTSVVDRSPKKPSYGPLGTPVGAADTTKKAAAASGQAAGGGG